MLNARKVGGKLRLLPVVSRTSTAATEAWTHGRYVHSAPVSLVLKVYSKARTVMLESFTCDGIELQN